MDSDGSTAWTSPGAAAFDFRSDVHTTPTLSMLTAIQQTTLLDDVRGEDPTTNQLEQRVASLLGHEAGLLVLSGTMGNLVATRSHLGTPPYSILCDHRAHLLRTEAGGSAALSGAMVTGIIPMNGDYLTLEDIKAHIEMGDALSSCPTRIIALENTLHGLIMPLDEVQRISTFAREHEIRMHLDGARLWDAVAARQGTLAEYGKRFDSVTVCFSKGLGAPIGSCLVGRSDFIHQARRIRKMLGGGLRQSGVIAAAASASIDDTFGAGEECEGAKLRAVHRKAADLAKFWTSLGGKLEKRWQTNMVWLDLGAVGVSKEAFAAMAAEEGLKVSGTRLVLHYQIGDDGVGKMQRVMKRLLQSDLKN